MSRTVTRRQLLLAAAAAAANLALASCGATPTATPVPPPTATKQPAAAAPTAAPAAPTTAATKAPAVAGKEGGLLRCGFPSQQDDLNPMRGLGRVNADTNRRIFSTLAQYDPDMVLIPDLAEKWSKSSDGKTYTFNLRQGIKWHDGEPFTSKDVLFTCNRHAHPAAQGGYMYVLDNLVGVDELRKDQADTISGIKIPDDNTVIFTLKSPMAAFPANLSHIYIVPEHILGKVSAKDFPTNPFWSSLPGLVGTGPYKITKYVAKQTFEYERNILYHLGKPKIEKMVWTQIASRDTIALALEKGDLDYSNFQSNLTKDTLDRLAKNAGLYLRRSTEPSAGHLSINFGHFPDKRVRQAICFALDRTALLEAVGGASVASILDYYFGNENANVWATKGALKWGDVYKYDPAKAKSLLQDAKWDFGKEVEIRTRGNEVQMTMVQEQLQSVGLKVKFTPVESAGPSTASGDFDLLNWQPVFDDPYQMAYAFTCAARPPVGASGSEYCNPDFDKLMADEAVAADDVARGAAYKKMQEILVNDAATALLTFAPNVGVFSKKVHADRSAWWVLDDSWNWWIE